MALATNDIVQITFRSHVFGQRVILVMNYRITATDSAQTNFDDLATIALKFSNTATPNLLFFYLKCLAPSVTVESVRAQVVRPVRTVFFDQVVGAIGTNASGNAVTANLAAVITRTTDLAGRSQISNSHIGPFNPGIIVSGVIFSSFLTILADLGAAMCSDYSTAAPTITLRPVILHKLGIVPASRDILRYTVQTTCRVMRRRTVGVGE